MTFKIGDLVTVTDQWKDSVYYGKVFKVREILNRWVWTDQNNEPHNMGKAWRLVDGPW